MLTIFELVLLGFLVLIFFGSAIIDIIHMKYIATTTIGVVFELILSFVLLMICIADFVLSVSTLS